MRSKILLTKTAIAIVIITLTPIGALIIFQSIKSYHKSPLGHAPHRSIQNPNATSRLAAALQAIELNKIRSNGSSEQPTGADRLSQFTAKIALTSKDDRKIAASKPHQFR
jgi:hypothetical protein